MSTPRTVPLVHLETTCRTLLDELQIIWDEIGETDVDRDEMLLELERECMEIYRRKVDQANLSKAHIKKTIADYEAELAAICAAMGERPVHIWQSDVKVGSLKEELGKILPQVEEMKKRKRERISHFINVLDQIQIIRNEISKSTESVSSETLIDETDLSLMKLEELHRELHELQKEKSNRLQQVQDHLNMLNSLCSVMGMDFKLTVAEVHASLGDSEKSRSISNNTIKQLSATINKLREVKIQRMDRLQDLATTMLELWNLMDTPIEEQQKFQDVTCNIAASEDEITEPNSLSEDFINYIEAEVSRLEELKSRKMKELVLKKRSELRKICRKTHLVPDTGLEDVIEAIESGVVDDDTILEQIELHIAKVKEEAFSRKEILEKIEKWLAACDEECWLEEYNRDENRYNLGKGTHLALKRAEKARALVNKLPGMTEALISKTVAWEEGRETEFLYDGIPLLSMLEDYAALREEKEQQRRRLRDQKKLQEQIIAEQEVLYGSKVCPPKQQTAKKYSKQSSIRRTTSGGSMVRPDSVHTPRTPQIHSTKKTDLPFQNDHLNHRREDAIPASPAFRRGMDTTDTPFRKHWSNAVHANEVESPLVRKPFSPIYPSPKNNMTNKLEDNGAHKTLQKMIPTDDLPDNLHRLRITTSLVDDENRMPKATHSMQTDTMQAPTTQNTKPIKGGHEGIEESFEERRLACMRSDSQITSLIQV
ncbi:65-kDa microtubule-associated protein 3 [Hibiscus syriacus]|uniref:65-kDa microtubule-associated protein 3 n=1 Tax=Hibiscus syriacus TaxID=106335 RepID=A0A6A3BNL7_HIBSY|nr:65-kDa microtubule-associated protein 9-like [Hibiscus syriacus]KAE8717461.1 65-kDa microtubule-associated protein 3 [Hibiscus syriacus]